MLPERFKRFLWSQDVTKMDPEAHRVTIVTAAINYGDLEDWRWLTQQYGRKGVAKTLQETPVSALRPPAARLAGLIFGIKRYPDAHRRSHA